MDTITITEVADDGTVVSTEVSPLYTVTEFIMLMVWMDADITY